MLIVVFWKHLLSRIAESLGRVFPIPTTNNLIQTSLNLSVLTYICLTEACLQRV